MNLGAGALLLVAAAAVALGVLVVPAIERRTGRPKFVVALCVVAVAVSGMQLAGLASADPASSFARFLGRPLRGDAAIASVVVHAALQLGGAWGLWLLRPWSRVAGMGYLGYLIASFLLWGVRGQAGEDAVFVIVWQLCVLPFLTFSMMYLYRGARYFS